jgi:hypothetical protein
MIANFPSRRRTFLAGRGISQAMTAISSNGMAILPVCDRNVAMNDRNIPIDNRNVEVDERNCDFAKSSNIKIHLE